MLRYLGLDLAAGIAKVRGVTLDAAYKHCERWVQAYFPAYQQGIGDDSIQRLHDLQCVWWSIALHLGLVPEDEWPSTWPPKPGDKHWPALRARLQRKSNASDMPPASSATGARRSSPIERDPGAARATMNGKN